MSLLLLASLYLSQIGTSNTLALPTPGFGAPNTSTLNLTSETGCICPSNQRSIWDILWSCLATIFACSWVAVHPNISSPTANSRQRALTRLELMVWTVIAPEIMIMWAMRQWHGARKLAKTYKDRNWTVTHGFFIQMGGFMLYDGEKPLGVLSPEKLESLLKTNKIDFPSVTQDEIEDRSKGDALSKTLALGQTTWFIGQCISRVVQGLITTELELITLGFAALNGFMYFFWLNKPLDVKTGVPVYLLNDPKKEEPVNEGNDADEEAAGEGTLLQAADGVSIMTYSTYESDTHSSSVERGNFSLITQRVVRCLTPVSAFFSRLGDMSDATKSSQSHIVEENAMEVPTFYAMELKNSEMRNMLLVISSIGILFGAIHTAGWNFSFPSHFETRLWRVCSLVITGAPFVMMIQSLSNIIWDRTTGIVEDIADLVTNISGILVAYVGIPFYIGARLALLVEAFVALRFLLPRALAQVQWTEFLPHI